jgi:hypothetical protein
MPTRTQRRRVQKGRRHEYETVWVDAEGNELEEPPEDAVAAPEKRTNGSKPKAKAAPQRGGRTGRVPQAPSWRRAAKRSLLLGVGIFVVVYISNASHGGNRTITALGFAALYTLLFIPLTFTMDRWTHNRFQRRAAEQGQKPKKR